jgi:peptide/nickel transport system permease protein
MRNYIARRLIHGAIVLVAVSFVIFLVMYLSPGDPAVQMYGAQPGVTQEMIDAARHDMGLDKPFIQQYFTWIGRFVQGDMGESYVNHLSVRALIGPKLMASFQLAVVSLALAMLIAVPGGILAAVKRGTWVDSLITGFVSIGIAVPGFWLGILLVLVFAVRFRWLPPSGYVRLTDDPGENLRLIILPATTMAILLAAPIMRFLRSGMLDVLGEDYIRVARAKGLSGRAVIRGHALRNASISTVTVLGLQFASLIGGGVIVEWVFGWPGLGWLAINAIFQRDYLLVEGTLVIVAATFILVNLAVDVLVATIDPRIRYE